MKRPVNQIAPADLPVPPERMLNELSMGYLARALARELRQREAEQARIPPAASEQTAPRPDQQPEASS